MSHIPPPKGPSNITKSNDSKSSVRRNELTHSHGNFTQAQIETLQNQIRLFKTLGKRYAESVIPKSIPQESQPLPPPNLSPSSQIPALSSQDAAPVVPQQPTNSQPPSSKPPTNPTNALKSEKVVKVETVVKAEKAEKAEKATPVAPDPSPPVPAPITTPTVNPPVPILSVPPIAPIPKEIVDPPPVLSWQCFYSLLMTGPLANRQTEGMVSIPPSEIGSFSKAANLPLVLTTPYVASLREKFLADALQSSRTTRTAVISLADESPLAEVQPFVNSEAIEKNNRLWELQRIERATAIEEHISSIDELKPPFFHGLTSLHPPCALGQGGFLNGLLPRKSFFRTRRQARKDIKLWERDDKKRRTDVEEKKKKRAAEFLKAVVAHRDEFVRFHKNKRGESAKAARAVKLHCEAVEQKRERDEQKAEMRRIQALKENDMEAYAKLVSETKNERLHFLIKQTDGYIATINSMVQRQREDDGKGDGLSGGSRRLDSASDSPVAVASSSSSAAQPGSPKAGGARGPTESGRDDAAALGGGAATVAGGVGGGDGSSASASGMIEPGSEGKLTATSREYYDSTHRKMERVSQPTMTRSAGDLKEYQLSGLQWMVSLYNNNLNGILADEMGLGKTIQTIALLTYLMEFKHNNGPFMVVVPLSTLSNWVNEMSKWSPDMIKVVYKGTPLVRKALYKEEVEPGHFNVLVTTYEYIMKDKSSLRKHQWQYIIVDEGHRMKNAQSKFAQTLGTVYNSRHRLLLTGTPLQNNLPELWALLNFLLPNIFSSVDTFDQWFNKPFSSFKNPAAAAAAAQTGESTDEVASLTQEERMLIVHRLHEVLRPFMLRRVKDQVLDQLPEKVETVIRCELSGWQRKLYNTIHNRSVAAKEKDSVGSGLNNAIMQLRKVCNHPYLFLTEWYMDEDLIRSSGKFELLDRMLPKLKAGGHRVLMFSQMTQVMTILESFFSMKGFQYLRLDGSTTADEREKRMYAFNDPDSPYFIFLLSTRAGGLGLNLATADTVILFDSDWNPMMDAQAGDRAHRIGQKNEVHIFRLVTTSPVEERILSRATDKRNLTDLVVEAGKFNAKEKGGEREMMESLLKELVSSAPGEEEEEEVEVPDDDQLNELMAVHAEELVLYQQMDRERVDSKQQQWQHTLRSLGRLVPGMPVPPLPPALMGPEEAPSWLLETHWANKMLTAAAQNPKKRGRKGKKKLTLDGGIGAFGGDGVFGGGGGDHAEDGGAGEDDDEDGLDGEEEDDDEDEEGQFVAGKLMRKRKEVTYDDGLTETQFQKLMERQADEAEAVERQMKIQKKQHRNSISFAASVTAMSMPTRVFGEEGTDPAGVSFSFSSSSSSLPSSVAMWGGGAVDSSAGAKRVSTASAFASASGSDSAVKSKAAGPPRGPRLKPLPEGGRMDETVENALAKIVTDLQKIKRLDGSCLAELFKAKPDKIIYPDYYQIISSPISYREITSRLKKHQYGSVQDVEIDIALMSHNARLFNSDLSPVFLDCESLRASFYEKAVGYGLLDASKSIAPPLPADSHFIYGEAVKGAGPHIPGQRGRKKKVKETMEFNTFGGAMGGGIPLGSFAGLDSSFDIGQGPGDSDSDADLLCEDDFGGDTSGVVGREKEEGELSDDDVKEEGEVVGDGEIWNDRRHSSPASPLILTLTIPSKAGRPSAGRGSGAVGRPSTGGRGGGGPGRPSKAAATGGSGGAATGGSGGIASVGSGGGGVGVTPKSGAKRGRPPSAAKLH